MRLQILNLLFDKGSLSYTELMNALKMNPSRDAGRFAYHLKFLLKADLIEAVVETKKYCLTDLGKMVIDVADRIEKKAFKPKILLVRASRSAIEEFDTNRIATSLMKEAKMSAELAQRLAKEAEKQLLKSKIKYLTAPLVREVVNAILIEQGLEEYRHKLTRLGIPVHDVTDLIKTKKPTLQKPSTVHEAAGETVLKEYTLLNVFPRDIADAHLSGSLHINGLSSWILKPTEIVHDIRFFLQNGLNLEKIDPAQPSNAPPQNLESALAVIFNMLLHSNREIDTTQTLDYFNIFLAPYIKGAEPAKLKEALRLLITNISQHTNTSIGLELTTPDFMAEKPTAGPNGKPTGKYGDFTPEIQLLASLLLEIFAEESLRKPLFNPKLILKIRTDTFKDEGAKAILLKAHNLASEKGIPYFANLFQKSRQQSIFSSSGLRLDADFTRDWELDTMRTGCVGIVTVNVPRVAYESGNDKAKFLEILKERLEMANRALEIKHQTLRQHGKDLLPFIMQTSNGDQYFRLENCSRIINLTGLRETAEVFCAKGISDEKTLGFMEEIGQEVTAFVHKISRRRGKRLQTATLPCFEASERLASLDIERYGVAKVRFSGTRNNPFYSTINNIIFQNGKTQLESFTTEQKPAELHEAGSLTVIRLGEAEHKADELVALTKEAFEKWQIEFLTYDRGWIYCNNCRKSWPDTLHKCPSCSATSTLTTLKRFQP